MEFIKLAGPAGMFFIMFSLALSLKINAFAGVFKNPISYSAFDIRRYRGPGPGKTVL